MDTVTSVSPVTRLTVASLSLLIVNSYLLVHWQAVKTLTDVERR